MLSCPWSRVQKYVFGTRASPCTKDDTLLSLQSLFTSNLEYSWMGPLIGQPLLAKWPVFASQWVNTAKGSLNGQPLPLFLYAFGSNPRSTIAINIQALCCTTTRSSQVRLNCQTDSADNYNHGSVVQCDHCSLTTGSGDHCRLLLSALISARQPPYYLFIVTVAS